MAAVGGLSVFFGGIELAVIAAAMAGITLTGIRGGAIAVAAAAVAAMYTAWFRATLPRTPPQPAQALPLPFKITVAAAGMLYVALWWLAWTIPDFGWDGLHYHNPVIHFWAVAGKVHWIEAGNSPWKIYVDSFWNGIPKGIELLGFFLVRTSGWSRLLNALNLPLVPLGILSCYTLSRMLGARRSWSWAASMLFIAVPVVTAQCLTTYVDAGVACVYIAAFALTAGAARALRSAVIPWKLLPALGCIGGLAAAAKGPGFAVPGIAFILCAAVGWKMVSRRSLVAFLAVWTVLVTLVGGYWAVRNFVHTGSPVYPVGLRIGAHTIFPGGWQDFPPPYEEEQAEWSQGKRILVSWLNFETDWSRAYSTNFGGLGHLWIFGAVPAAAICMALAVFARGSRRPDPLTLGILLAFCVPLFFFMPYHHNHKVRYVVWLYGLGLPAFAFVGGLASRSGRIWMKRLLRSWWAFVVIVALGEGWFAFWVQVERLDRMQNPDADAPLSLNRILNASVAPYPAAIRWPTLRGTVFEDVFQRTDSVAIADLVENHELLLGHLTQGPALGKRRIFFLDSGTANDPEKLRSFIRDNGIRLVIYEWGTIPPEPLRKTAVIHEQVGKLFRILAFVPEPSTEKEHMP